MKKPVSTGFGFFQHGDRRLTEGHGELQQNKSKGVVAESTVRHDPLKVLPLSYSVALCATPVSVLKEPVSVGAA